MIFFGFPLILIIFFVTGSVSGELGIIDPIAAWAAARQNSFVLFLKEEGENVAEFIDGTDYEI